ncbi:MAG: hypothetical protein JXB88_03130 [Spirochaetales bacterium]|nr:hypothetical protein [Spirochaetales bacterium]
MAKKLSIEKKGNFSGLPTSDIIKKNKNLKTQIDELRKKSIRLTHISELRQEEPFKSLFPIEDKVLQGILADMKENGFDNSKPIDVWKGIVIDGNTRFNAAVMAGIKEVAVYDHKFRNQEEALEYAVHNQRDRRNITDAEIYKCVEILDNRRSRGGDRKSEDFKSSSELLISREKTAQTIGTSAAKVQKARTIQDHGDKKTINAVKQGKISINKAYTQVQEKRKKNKQNSNDQNNEMCKLKIFICRNDKSKLLHEFQVLKSNVKPIMQQISKIIKNIF